MSVISPIRERTGSAAAVIGSIGPLRHRGLVPSVLSPRLEFDARGVAHLP